MCVYKQGQLDYLCGVYCLVNSISNDEDDAPLIFGNIIEYLSRKSWLKKAITGDGITMYKMDQIIRHAIPDKFDIKHSMPFNKNTDAIDFWTECNKQLNTLAKSVIIFIELKEEIKDKPKDHWTVISSVEGKNLNLCDSYFSEITYFNPKTFLVMEGQYKIKPEYTIFLN